MQVKYLELPKQFDNPKIFDIVKDQLSKCQFVLGDEVTKFEKNLACLCQTEFALGLANGTDALILALKALKICAGHEVITVPNSFVATAAAIVAVGAKPVFIDVGPDYNMNPDLIEQAISARTRAILPVHLTGNPAQMPAIMGIAKKHNLFVIEDAAQAVGAKINGKTVGSFGQAASFSLHPLKNLNVCGDGGAVTTSSEDLYNTIKLLRNHGLKNRDEIEFFGYNSRLDSIQAAIANYGLQNLADITQKRQEHAKIYDQGLKDLAEFVTLPPRAKNVEQVFHTYVIQVADRSRLIQYLLEHGVETKIHYAIPIHLQKPGKELGYKKGDFPVCEKQSERILTLPIHQYMAQNALEYVIGNIRKFYGMS